MALLLTSAPLPAQELSLAAGPSVLLSHLSNPEGYAPTYYLLGYVRPLGRRPAARRGRFFWYLEPQYNRFGRDWEAGLNAGVQYRYRLGDRWKAYALAGLGPHYLTLDSRRQDDGFIFSDNLAVGLLRSLGGRWQIRLEGRFRHLSNANLTKPNGGLNHLFGLLGITYDLGGRSRPF